MSDTVQLQVRRGREGNRWVNHRPSPEEVAEWFEKTVKLHSGMAHADFVSGITLIQETASGDEIAGFSDEGRPTIVQDVTNVFFTPYPKVETKVDYFNRWMENHADAWVGTVEPVAGKDSGGLPDGFAPLKVAMPDGKIASLITYSARVKVVKREGHQWVDVPQPDGTMRRQLQGEIVLLGGVGTKGVPMLDRFGSVSDFAVERAQTGGVGRALGMAGILVVPGTGVATAEDMRDMQNAGQIPGAPGPTDAAAAQPEPGSDDRQQDPDVMMRANVVEMLNRLKEDHPGAHEQFQAWAREREFRALNTITGPALKGIVKKLEKTLDAAQRDSVEDKASPDIDLTGGDD